jgi:hypothetical protein
MTSGPFSLNSMMQRELKNEVSDTLLKQCPEEDRMLVDNVLRVAQAELNTLNLASATLCIEGRKLTIKCILTGPSPSVSLSTMRSIQAYSPARILDLRTLLHDNNMYFVIELSDSLTRICTTELEVIRIMKKRRIIDRILGT